MDIGGRIRQSALATRIAESDSESFRGRSSFRPQGTGVDEP
jgi:hypothetical protein